MKRIGSVDVPQDFQLPTSPLVGAAKGPLLAETAAGRVFPRSFTGGPSARWINDGRGLWELTPNGADRIVFARGFGTIYRSSSDGLWWAADNAGHGGSAFKVFRETGKGLEWYRDADHFGDFIIGKHKGDVGRFIPWSQTSGVR